MSSLIKPLLRNVVAVHLSIALLRWKGYIDTVWLGLGWSGTSSIALFVLLGFTRP
ncbi:hypothetical protein CY34DRAFT_805885, partial [Suillus luteus UH-Slu-Lm8-n1]